MARPMRYIICQLSGSRIIGEIGMVQGIGVTAPYIAPTHLACP